MKEVFRTAALGFALLAVSGCASRLELSTDAEGKNSVAGVPFRAAELYAQQGNLTVHSKGEKCTETPTIDFVALPTGAQYYLNVEPAQLAKTGLEVQFSDKGTLSQIKLNTEPSGTESIGAVAGVVAQLLPFAGVTAKVADPKLDESGLKPCDTGLVVNKMEKFEDWVKAPGGTPSPAK